MKKSFLSLAAAVLCITTFSLNAQTFNKGAIIVEGNNYGSPGNLVKMAKYEPSTKNYVYFDSILGDFTNDVLNDGHYAYIHVGNADPFKDRIYKYNVVCPQKLDSIVISGFQKMKISNDKLIVSRAFGADSNFVEIYDKNDFSLIASIPEVNQQSNGIAIGGGKAYVGVNGSWPAYTDSGTVAVIDLASNSFERFIKLDTFAKVVNNVFLNADKLYCIADYDKITEYDLTMNTFTHYYNTGIDAANGIIGNKIYFSDYVGLASFDVTTHVYTSLFPLAFTQIKLDEANNEFYFLNQDWTAYTSTFIRTNDSGNIMIDSFQQGVASVFDFYIDSNNAPITSNYFVNLYRDNDTSFQITASDVDCDALVYSISAGPARIGAVASVDNTGIVSYTTAVGLVAPDTTIVRITDLANISSYATIYFNITDPLAINEIALANLIQVYPNPFAGKLMINNLSNQTLSLQILDISGQFVFAKKITNSAESMDLSWLSNGVYFAKVTIGAKTFNKKIIKQ